MCVGPNDQRKVDEGQTYVDGVQEIEMPFCDGQPEDEERDRDFAGRQGRYHKGSAQPVEFGCKDCIVLLKIIDMPANAIIQAY